MKKRIYYLIFGCILLTGYYFSLPHTLFHDPYSTVLEGAGGELLSASIAADGQWRFPQQDSVPDKFAQAIVAFEDKRFWSHPGVDVLAFGRALRQNISAGQVVSGGSTLTMQVIRLSRKGQPRTIFEKMWEMVLATRLELRNTKEEILNQYAAHAPFGGNVVGIEAACWRYFGRETSDLSWAEAATLAVLPNAPALIHPGRNREALQWKRDNLLDKLWRTGVIDSFTCVLAKQEPIPEEPRQLPRLARHLLSTLQSTGHDQQRVHSTIQYTLQERVEQLLADHHKRLQGNQIHHAAILVADVKTGNVLAYVGNISSQQKQRGDEVDIIRAARSTGSILKPFLFAAALDDGKLLPTSLLPDVPVYLNGFTPKNFSRQYDGVVPANEALIRSLNVPAVYLLRDYRYEKFHALLQRLGMTTLHHPPDHYGLSLILGGAEGTLWDITGMYASMGRTLNNYFEHSGKNKYDANDIHPLHVRNDQQKSKTSLEESASIRAGAIYQTFDILTELYRPGEESGWKLFTSARKIAWKTGTSFGFRDGWAVGITPQYVVGVWVGNANGEGRPGLTGTDAAAPILFDVFAQLPAEKDWFGIPKSEFHKIPVCALSGNRITPACEKVDSLNVVEAGLQSSACSYHKIIHVTSDGKFRVHAACEDVAKMVARSWFVLPPIQEYYYKGKNISYKAQPPFRKDCAPSVQHSPMDFIYPKENARVFIPRELSGKPGQVIVEIAHTTPKAIVYWHLDDSFIGVTQHKHRLELNPAEGMHKLTAVDAEGNFAETSFHVMSGM